MLIITSLFIILFFASCAPAKIVREEPAIVCPLPKTGNYYVVKKGDSLWRIAKNYGFSADDLMLANKDVSVRDLKVGQKIFIPERVRDSRLFIWPLNGEVINHFGQSVNNSINRGLNIRVASGDRQVRAAASGTIVFSDYLKGWGKTVILKHSSDFYTVYAHLDNTLLKEGSCGSQGDVIGQVASARDGSFVLHFEIRKRYIPQDPSKYLN